MNRLTSHALLLEDHVVPLLFANRCQCFAVGPLLFEGGTAGRDAFVFEFDAARGKQLRDNPREIVDVGTYFAAGSV